MGAGGMPNKGVKRVDGRRGDLPVTSIEPGIRQDLYVDGVKIQSRWFDEEGKAEWNRDYDHQNAHDNHDFPHDHSWHWDNGKPVRSKDSYDPDYQKYH